MESLTTEQKRNLETIIARLHIILKENPTMNEKEAILLAFKQEQDFITEMLEQKTERSKKAFDKICKDVYGLSHIFN